MTKRFPAFLALLANPLVLALVGAITVAAALYVTAQMFAVHSEPTLAPGNAGVPAAETWVAVAPGRVEAKSGEVQLSAGMAGQIQTIAVLGTAVKAGDVVASFDSKEAVARLSAAQAEAAFRLAERDRTGAVDERQQAEASVARARGELEAAIAGRTTKADALEALKVKVGEAEQSLQTIIAISGATAPTRSESALQMARAEVIAAEAALVKTTIRSPIDGQVVRVFKRVGESIATASDVPVASVADLASLRVRADLDERDIAKVSVGQVVQIRAETFANRSFEGQVVSIALVETPRNIASRGAQPGADGILEVLIDLKEGTSLIPGMRVDAYFEEVDLANNGAFHETQ